MSVCVTSRKSGFIKKTTTIVCTGVKLTFGGDRVLSEDHTIFLPVLSLSWR